MEETANTDHPKGSDWSFIDWLLIGACIVMALVVVFAWFVLPRLRPPVRHRTQSLSNIKQCDLAAIMYQNDYDGHYPSADVWVDKLLEYSKTESIFHDSDMPEPTDYGFAFRDKASRVKDVDIVDPSRFIVIFSSDIKGRNAHGDLGSMPPTGRGSGSNSVAFADGHAKRVQAISTVPSTKPDWLRDDSKAGPKESKSK